MAITLQTVIYNVMCGIQVAGIVVCVVAVIYTVTCVDVVIDTVLCKAMVTTTLPLQLAKRPEFLLTPQESGNLCDIDIQSLVYIYIYIHIYATPPSRTPLRVCLYCKCQ